MMATPLIFYVPNLLFGRGSFIRLVTHLWLRFGVEIRRQDRRGLRVIDVNSMVIIPGWGRCLFIAQRSAHAKQFKETGNGYQKRITVFLHLERLPLYDRSHRSLDARLLAYNAVNLFWSAIANRGDQDSVRRQNQQAEGDQHHPTALRPFPNDLADKHQRRQAGSQGSSPDAPGAFPPREVLKDVLTHC